MNFHHWLFLPEKFITMVVGDQPLKNKPRERFKSLQYPSWKTVVPPSIEVIVIQNIAVIIPVHVFQLHMGASVNIFACFKFIQMILCYAYAAMHFPQHSTFDIYVNVHFNCCILLHFVKNVKTYFPIICRRI